MRITYYILFAVTTIAHAWTPGVSQKSQSTGFVVDTESRNDVISFWYSVYAESEDVDLGWEGSHQNFMRGDNSAESVAATERRINYYRAMAGIDANVEVNNGARVVIGSEAANLRPASATTRLQATQEAAFNLSFANKIDHNPRMQDTRPGGARCWGFWSSTFWNGANYSNMTTGFTAANAIDAYIRENDPTTLSLWNTDVGHRRWILYPRATEFASADVPADLNVGSFLTMQPVMAANALYVIQEASELNAPLQEFVPWPNAGFFPEQIYPLNWSLSRSGADFSAAEIEYRFDNGEWVEAEILSTRPGFGDPAIVWSMPVAPDVSTADAVVDIRVTRISGEGVPASHEYQVRIINTRRLVGGGQISGSDMIPVAGAALTLPEIEHAESVRLVLSKKNPENWTEGGESEEYLELNTTGSYDPLEGFVDRFPEGMSDFFRSGDHGMRLSFPTVNDLSDQEIRLTRWMLPKAGNQLDFWYRRGFMTVHQRVKLQYTTGFHWVDLWSISGTAATASAPWGDNQFVNETVSLPTTGDAYRLRFIMEYSGNLANGDPVNCAEQRHANLNFAATGFFLDDIEAQNVEWLDVNGEFSYPGNVTQVLINEETFGEPLVVGETVVAQLQAVLGCENLLIPGHFEATPSLIALEGWELFRMVESPGLGAFDMDDDGDGIANGLEYAFGSNPLDESSAVEITQSQSGRMVSLTTPVNQMRSDVTYEGEFSTNMETWNSVEVEFTADGNARFSVPLSDEPLFLRWRISLGLGGL